MPYASGQFRNIVPHLPCVPDWFILAGPADGDEAQCAARNWSNEFGSEALNIIGLEPCHESRTWQLENGWPTPETLLPHALWDSCGTAKIAVPDFDKPITDPECWQAKHVSHMREQEGRGLRTVSTVTFDYLDRLYGPFEGALLWIDIEGAEMRALQRARTSLQNGHIMAINIECLIHVDSAREDTERVNGLHEYLTERYMKLAHCWGNDRVYVRA